MTLFIFGLILSLPLVLNLLASRDEYTEFVDALFAAGMLCAIWAFTNIVGHLYPFPQSKEFHPLVDLIGLSVAVAAYMTQRRSWKFVLASLFLLQLIAHVWFWVAWSSSPAGGIARGYVEVLNLLWIGQLVCVGSPGGAHVSRRALDWLRNDRGLSHPLRH